MGRAGAAGSGAGMDAAGANAGGGVASTGDRPGTIMQGDRRKAYRPLSPEARRSALEAGLHAYSQGDFFEAHEFLEPAWMGTSDLAERALYQGLIKLAAGYVHAVRGNPIGLARNLEGARRHLETSLDRDPGWGSSLGIDLPRLVDAIDDRLASIRALPTLVESGPAAMLDLAADAPRIR